MNIKHPDHRKWWVQLGMVSTMGIAMALSIAISVLAGYFLDEYLGTDVFFWIGLVVGILAAYRSMWVIYVRYVRDQ